jgi:hypothetical protein
VEAKSAALLRILTAGADVEGAIRENRADIDLAMVALLDRRIKAAARWGSPRRPPLPPPAPLFQAQRRVDDF